MLGLYVSGHPINAYKQELLRHCSTTLAHLNASDHSRQHQETIGGVVIQANERNSKRDGSKFYMLTLDDATSQFTIPLYGSQAETMSKILEEREEALEKLIQSAPVDTDKSQLCQSPLIVVAKVTCFQGEDGVRTRVQRLETLEQLRRRHAKSITISLTRQFYEQHAGIINNLLLRNLISIAEIRRNLERLGLSPRLPLPVWPEQGAYGSTGAPGTYGAPGGQVPYGAPGGQVPYGAPGGQVPYGAPGGQVPYGGPGAPGAPGAGPYANQRNGAYDQRNDRNERGGRNSRYNDNKAEDLWVDEGCTFSLLIDDACLHFTNQRYRLVPRDDLIDGIRDLAGADAIAVGY